MTTQIWNADLLRTNFEYDIEANALTIEYGTKADKGEPLEKLGEVTFAAADVSEDIAKMVFLQGLAKLVGNKRAKTGVVWTSADAEQLVASYQAAFDKLADGTYWNRASGEGRALGSSDFLNAVKQFYSDAGKEFVQADFEEKYGRNAKVATEEQKLNRRRTETNKKVEKILERIRAARKPKVEAASDGDI